VNQKTGDYIFMHRGCIHGGEIGDKAAGRATLGSVA